MDFIIFTCIKERGVGDWDVGLGRILLAAKEKVWIKFSRCESVKE